MADFSALAGSGVVAQVAAFVLNLISSTGYSGIFVLMTLESALVPVPSEIIMPFAGYLAFLHELDFALVVVIGAIANVAGSLIAYAIGLYIGKDAVLKHGKFLLIKRHHLETAEKWFAVHGDKAILISRCLPLIRTVISLPAGFAKMSLKKFIAYTFIGSLIWSFILAYVGFFLGNEWTTIFGYTHYLDLAVAAGILLLIAYFFVNWRTAKKSGI